ncbi:hypothetical protein [Klebsiella phage vB_KpnM-VAC36]|nr:hypothetical protein [Klebsiella phage vB_KpnM-VAC36]
MKQNLSLGQSAISNKPFFKLISEGEAMADATGEHFYAGNEEYIPVTSDEWESYKWIRDDNYLPHDQGFWYSSSMQNC